MVPRHPINIYYNASTEAQEVDEYNTLYLHVRWRRVHPSTTTTCLTTPSHLPDIVNRSCPRCYENMLTNNPEPSYVHQTNMIGILPGCTDASGHRRRGYGVAQLHPGRHHRHAAGHPRHHR